MSHLLIKMNMTSHIYPAKNLATLCSLLKMSTYAPSKTLATIPNRYPQFILLPFPAAEARISNLMNNLAICVEGVIATFPEKCKNQISSGDKDV
jgi:hypothetical protein